METFPVITAYDITDQSNRNKVLKIMKQWRLGGQKSLHECRLSKMEMKELFIQLGTLIDTKKDRLLMARLESHREILCRGTGKSHIYDTYWHIK